MQRFEITVAGRVVGRDYATQHEAEEAAITARQDHKGQTVEVRPKADGGEKGKPEVNANGIIIGNGKMQETASAAPSPAPITGRTETATAETAHLEAGARPSGYPRR